MKYRENKAADGSALWNEARASVLDDLKARAPDLDEADLAAYLDGGLDAAGFARVEAALTASPEILDVLISARAALDAGPVEAPEALIARAQALVPEPERRASLWRRRFTQFLAPVFQSLSSPRRGLAFASMAAGFLLVSVAGFELGRAEVDYNAQVDGFLAQEFVGLIARDGEDFL